LVPNLSENAALWLQEVTRPSQSSSKGSYDDQCITLPFVGYSLRFFELIAMAALNVNTGMHSTVLQLTLRWRIQRRATASALYGAATNERAVAKSG
jgi:hypothetical protein